MRALRLLVIVLGVLLVGGTLALVVAIIVRSPRPSESRPPDSAKLPYDTVLDLPAGDVIESVQPAGVRDLLHLGPPGGKTQNDVLAALNGGRRRTVEPRASPRAEPSGAPQARDRTPETADSSS